MMTVSGRIPIRCAALILVLTSVSAVQRLNSISDLRRVNFGQSVSTHSLVLLHWFANTVTIDSDDVIRLNFDPNRRDYGSHSYGNYEGLLDPLPRGYTRYRYYTVGNLYQQTEMPLPSHVVHRLSEYAGRNRARIIVRAREQNVDQVYITQHYDRQGAQYDPDQTYLVTTDLLRQIRQFSTSQCLLMNVSNRFGSSTNDSHVATQKGIYTYQPQYSLQSATRRDTDNDSGKVCVIIIVLLLFFALAMLMLGSISK